MPEGIIGMSDMETIFSVTDGFGIHRESVQVELTKEDPGAIGRTASGTIEITVPESLDIQEFASRLHTELESLGYEAGTSPPDGEDEEEEDWP